MRKQDKQGKPDAVRIDEARARIEHLAYHDSLTGLPNRLLLKDRLSVALSRSVRTRTLVVVVFLDLDNFKPVNDRLGHVGGDGLLREAARRLRTVVRQEDTLARFGGDEFVIVAEGLQDLAGVASIAEKVLAAIRAPFEIDGRDLFLTASLGVSIGQQASLDGEELIHNADTAMYRAKERGRNRYELYTPALSSRAEARRDFESSLREAVSAGDLSLAYQPIFQIANGGVFGVEAFARWPSRERGPVPPAEFIAVAEETGIVVALGRPLRRFAFDFLKVDPSFIQVAREESRDAVIAKSVIRMGRLLGATVIAEGVETTEQLEFLRYHRCDAAQGWLFSPAVTAEAFERDFLPIAVR